MVIPLYGVIFFIVYLSLIWFYNARFMRGLKSIADERRKYAKWVVLANIFLASGDSVLFLSLLISYMQGAAPCGFSVFYLTFFSGQPATQFLTVSGGIFATSITMSFYYLFLGFYSRDKLGTGKQDPLMLVIYLFFAARIILLFNPNNIWLASCLPGHMPNYSAWLRNAPFFIYGIMTIIMLPAAVQYRGVLAASLSCSFVFYSIDIFFSHSLPRMAIWMTYIVKTIAYIVAAITMWQSEFTEPAG
jgi:hypothetical protein